MLISFFGFPLTEFDARLSVVAPKANYERNRILCFCFVGFGDDWLPASAAADGRSAVPKAGELRGAGQPHARKDRAARSEARRIARIGCKIGEARRRVRLGRRADL